MSPRGDGVTVVVTCFEQGHLLAEAVASARAQRVPPEEIIVVDDGSTDATPTVCEGLAGVTCLRQPNRGLSAARNAGLARAASSHVIFLDADDRLLPDAIGAGLRCVAREPGVAFVAGGHRRIDATGEVTGRPDVTGLRRDHHRALREINVIGMHAAVLYARETLVAAGGFDESLARCEDYDVYLRLSAAHPVQFHDAIVADYRIHPGTLSGNAERMLGAALAVQRRHAGDAASPAAWFDLYGRRVARDAWDELVAGDVRAAAGRVRRLHALSPTETRRLLALGARRAAAVGARRTTRALGLPDRPLRRWLLGRLLSGAGRRPFSREFGYERGTPVDRVFIERFLEEHRDDVVGTVLEIGDSAYTHRFGGARVTRAECLHLDDPAASYTGSLDDEGLLPEGRFDCVLFVQTLHLLHDVDRAIAILSRLLAPGGTLLLTVPGISQVSDDRWAETWSWGFTPYALRASLAARFADADVHVRGVGNVAACTAFLHGLAAEEIGADVFRTHDPAYPLVVCARVATASGADAEARAR